MPTDLLTEQTRHLAHQFPSQSFMSAKASSMQCLASATASSIRGAKVCSVECERQVSPCGVYTGTPVRPLALRDDLVSPIVVRVCCCHRRASQEPPPFAVTPQAQCGSRPPKRKRLG